MERTGAPGLGRVGIWAGDLDRCTAEGVREAAATVEQLGYDTLWFTETTGREAMAQAAILLSATRRITVALGMADIYARDAVTAAAGRRTLAEAFPGRFVLGLWESHPDIATDVRGHRYGPPAAAMRNYLDGLDAAPFGPPGSSPTVLSALGVDMLALAGERTDGATVLGMPVEYTRTARSALGPDARLAVTQLCVLTDDRVATARLAAGTAAAAMPNRRALLRESGYAEDERLVEALVAHGDGAHIAHRVRQHLAAGADHVSVHVLTETPDRAPLREWERLAPHLLTPS